MDKTNIRVTFSIYGDNFDPDFITSELEIEPSETYKKGDLLKNGRLTRRETSWSIDTGYEESYDINVQLEKIVNQLVDKKDKLVELKQQLNVEMLFMIVVVIENKETPGMYFKKPFIRFMNDIDAEVGFDVYV